MKALNLSKNFFLLMAILPALFLGFLVFKYSVNVPVWDQWDKLGGSLEKIQQGQLSFQHLVSQHNESRPFFPRILFLALAYLTGWNVKSEILMIFLLACLISLSTFLLSRKTIPSGRNLLIFLTLLFNLLIFSPVQWENWLWGVQFIVFVPILCLIANILIAFEKFDIRVKVISQILLCTLSMYSYANGMVCWILSPIALLLSGSWSQLRQQKWLIGLWGLSFTANFWLYFRDYVKPGYHPSMKDAFVHPFTAITYFLSFLGSPLSTGSNLFQAFPGENAAISASVGAVLMILFVLQVVYLAVFFQRGLLQRLGGWLLIQSYVLISASITTLGRVGFGVDQSLSSRYTTFSVYLAVGLIGAIAIILQDMQARKPFAQFTWANDWNQREISQIIAASLTTGLIALHLLTAYSSYRTMQTVYRDRLYAKTCLTFVRSLPDDCIRQSLYPVALVVQERAEIADQMNFFQPRLAKNRRIRQADPGRYNDPTNFGFFDAVVRNGDVFTASGWAIFPNEKRVADSILLTFQRGERSLLFDIAPVKNSRQDVADLLQDDRYTNSGWTVTFPAGRLPQRDKVLVLEAWAYNSENGEAFKLATTHTVDPTASQTASK